MHSNAHAHVHTHAYATLPPAAVDPNLPLGEAFRVADDVLRSGVRGISDIITIPGLVNVDFADVKGGRGWGGGVAREGLQGSLRNEGKGDSSCSVVRVITRRDGARCPTSPALPGEGPAQMR